MTLLATDTQRFSAVIKNEFWIERGWCRKAVTAYEATAKTYVPGTVLARTLTSGVGTPAAVTGNTGAATVGSVTVYSSAKVGVYVVKALATGATGAFAVHYPDGSLAGMGVVGTAFTGGGLSFTITDGTPDLTVGDAYTIAVTGTERYSVVAANSELSDVVIFVADNLGLSRETAIAATTATTVIAIYRGPAEVGASALVYGTDVNTDAEKAAVMAALEARQIMIDVQV